MNIGAIVWLVSMLTGVVLGEIACPGNPDCTCQKGYHPGETELECPKNGRNLTFTGSFKPNNYIKFQCPFMKDWKDFSMVSGLEVGPVNSFILKLCPLPGISFKELMATMGIPSAVRINFMSHMNLSDTLSQAHLQGLHDLKELNLNNNALTRLPEDLFRDLGGLSWLDLKHNNIRLVKGIFRNVPNLEVLELGNNNMSSLEQGTFKNLTRLRLLNLWGNRLHNLTRAVFSDIPNLESLDLNSNGLTTMTPDLFADLIKLKNINLYSNDFISLPQSLFRNSPLLEKVQLQNNRRTLKTLPPRFLADLEHLKSINLDYCNLTRLPGDLINGCILLHNITIRGNQLTELPEEFFKDNHEINKIILAHNAISSFHEKTFYDLEKLKILDVSFNKLTNISQTLFGTLYNLETLIMSHNMISSIPGQAFEVLINLKYLDMSHNRLSGIHKQLMDDFGVHSILQSSVKLEKIYLSHNRLSTIYVDWQLSMTNLDVLDLSSNSFTQLAVDELQFVSTKLTLNLENNNITKITFDNAEELAIMKYKDVENHKTNAVIENLSVKVNLRNNPVNCDCRAYNLVRYFKGQLAPEVNLLATLEGSNLACASPEELKGQEVSSLDPRVLTCQYTKEECTTNCTCHYRPSNRALLIDCSNRGLLKIPTQLPNDNITLQLTNHTELDLSHNKLVQLPNSFGNGYSRITKVYLSHNNLTRIDVTAFSSELQVLELDHNNFTRLDSASLKKLENATHLEKLTLHNNPWICDCESQDYLSFLQIHFKKIHFMSNITCPNGKPLSDLTVLDICANTSILLGIGSMIVALLGLVIGGSAAIYYRYQREIKVWLYAHRMCLWLVTEEELDKDKIYDAFISYSHQDEKFVVEDLVPSLESGPTKFKLCLHYRDWLVGEFIPTQIARSVDESRRTVVVLSPNFLESVWGRMEFKAAHSQALTEKRARVIIILYGEIGPTENLDPELRSYLSMNTYVKWGDPWFWEKLRYALPHPAELSKGLPLIRRHANSTSINGNEKLMNGSDPNASPPAVTTPPANALLIEPLKTLSNSKPV